MPIYEFYCPDNHKLYSFLARSLAHSQTVPQCPDNPSWPLQRRVSAFAIVGKAKEESENDPFAGIDDAKMESLMADMEGSLPAMDDENQDPRQLGHFMRKMTDLMGSKAPPELRDLVRRLEAGESPDKLEDEYGSLGEGQDDPLFGQVKKILHAARPPARDPKLYELRDYLPET